MLLGHLIANSAAPSTRVGAEMEERSPNTKDGGPLEAEGQSNKPNSWEGVIIGGEYRVGTFMRVESHAEVFKVSRIHEPATDDLEAKKFAFYEYTRPIPNPPRDARNLKIRRLKESKRFVTSIEDGLLKWIIYKADPGFQLPTERAHLGRAANATKQGISILPFFTPKMPPSSAVEISLTPKKKRLRGPRSKRKSSLTGQPEPPVISIITPPSQSHDIVASIHQDDIGGE
ncbi:hypothetical protein B0H63DRAFT_483948 [Podospora didyma]|uniref:Uncharacterized protein n=1 Tax=Podospora didyma TaxID=330526 RepID=A0AAE0K9Q4_9PEZI|nr:hypothetical protein B0H63DRAFT_483948 [Podospora didyma]